METEKNRCQPVCGGALSLTLCDKGMYGETENEAKQRYDLVDVTLVLRFGMVEDGEHSSVITGLCSVLKRVWINGRRMKGLH